MDGKREVRLNWRRGESLDRGRGVRIWIGEEE